MPLVFVPTPLGNLRDVTLRALDVLREADLIVAEDTRVGRKLLHALGIEGREIWSYREQNAASVTSGIVERARTSLVAVTSDADRRGVRCCELFVTLSRVSGIHQLAADVGGKLHEEVGQVGLCIPGERTLFRG